jgi:serine/threonine protein kinase/tetratricopeptide (TPR) repeat protein
LIGETVGPFRIVAELGRGGMGTVYLAEATEPVPGVPADSQVALKLFHRHLSGDPETERRFLQEAQLGARLDSEHVVRTFGAGTADVKGQGPVRWLSMEFVRGQTLRELLREIGPFPEPLALLLARQAAQALASIHDAGIIHRDVKPENLLVTADHRLKLMDLGVARIQEASLRLSHTGEFLGSLPYAAPEQFDGTPVVDGRADIYSLGVVLYEVLTGRNPFAAADPFSSMRRHMEVVPDKPGMVNPQISHLLEELVMTCLEKKREDRFPDAAALLDALEQGAASRWWSARQTISLKPGDLRSVRRVRIPRETAVFGRDRELEQLEEWFKLAAAGRGQVALVVGEPGIGKTRLLDELAARIEAARTPFQYLHGSTPPEGSVRPLQPFTEALLDRFGEERIEDALQRLLRATPVLVPAFASFLRGAPPPAGAEPLTRDSMLTVAAECFRTLTEDRPTILVVDDLHFADEETRRLFAYLARQAPDLKLLLVGTARPERLLAEFLAGLEMSPGGHRLALGRLGAKESVALLRDSLGSPKTVDHLGLPIIEKADGNPFFIFEIVRGLKERGALTPQPDGTWAAKMGVTEIDVPSTVRDLLMLRLSELDEDDMDVLHAAAVQGFEFDPEVVADALSADRLPVLKRLGALERRQRLVRHLGYRYRFDHHLVREMVYEDLAQPLREEYHRLVGDALRRRAAPPEVVASHFFRSSRPDEGLVDLLPGVARLLAAFQNEVGASLCRLGLKVLPAGDDPERAAQRFEVMLHLATFLDRLGLREEQEKVLSDARALLDRLGGAERAIRLFDSLSLMFANTGRFEEARQAAEKALKTASDSKDLKGETRASKSLGMVAWSLGRMEDARALYERSLHLARQLDDRKEEADALNNLGTVAQNTGDYEGARTFLEQALVLHRANSDRWGEARSLSNLGIVAYSLGRYDEAKDFYERALRIRRDLGDRQGEGNSLNNLGAVAHYLGRYEEARAYHEQSLLIKRQTGDRAGEAAALNNLGNVAYAQGDLDEAEKMHSRAIEIRRAIGDVRGQAYSVSNLGLVLQEMGRIGDARRMHEEALSLNHVVGDRAGAAIALNCLGSLATSRGSFEDAEKLLQDSLDACRAVSDPRGESYAVTSLAELARQKGDSEGARRLHERALDLRRRLQYTHGVMSSRLMLGDVYADLGLRDEAREALVEAADLAGKLGRPGQEALARTRLALLEGAPPPPQDPSAFCPAEEQDLRWVLLRLAEARGDSAVAGQHRKRLRELLEASAASLPPEERDAFWKRVTPNRLLA